MGILLGSKDVTDGREGRQYLNRDHMFREKEVDQVHDFPQKGLILFQPKRTEESSGILAIFCVDLCGPGGPCPWVPGFTTSPSTSPQHCDMPPDTSGLWSVFWEGLPRNRGHGQILVTLATKQKLSKGWENWLWHTLNMVLGIIRVQPGKVLVN